MLSKKIGFDNQILMISIAIKIYYNDTNENQTNIIYLYCDDFCKFKILYLDFPHKYIYGKFLM